MMLLLFIRKIKISFVVGWMGLVWALQDPVWEDFEEQHYYLCSNNSAPHT